MLILAAKFLVTPKFRVLLQIQSFQAKHPDFTPKFVAYRLGHHFFYLKG
mgnify:CR=1 FL=1